MTRRSISPVLPSRALPNLYLCLKNFKTNILRNSVSSIKAPNNHVQAYAHIGCFSLFFSCSYLCLKMANYFAFGGVVDLIYFCHLEMDKKNGQSKDLKTVMLSDSRSISINNTTTRRKANITFSKEKITLAERQI